MDFFVFISEQWLLVSLLVILIYAFAFTERQRGGKPLPTHEITRLLNNEEAVLVDVREKKEFDSGHVAGAVHIPYSRVSQNLSELEKYRDKTIVVADKLGQHAGQVGKTLRKEGFEVRRMQGGMSEWANQGLPLVRDK